MEPERAVQQWAVPLRGGAKGHLLQRRRWHWLFQMLHHNNYHTEVIHWKSLFWWFGLGVWFQDAHLSLIVFGIVLVQQLIGNGQSVKEATTRWKVWRSSVNVLCGVTFSCFLWVADQRSDDLLVAMSRIVVEAVWHGWGWKSTEKVSFCPAVARWAITNQSRYLGDRLTLTYVALDSRPKGSDLTKH